MKKLLISLAVIASLAFSAGWHRLSAQDGLTIKVIPRIGLTSPDSYFYEEFKNFGGDQPTEWTSGALGRSAYLGLGLEVGYEDKGIFLRGELGHTVEGWLSVVHGIVIPRIFFEPPKIVNTYLDVPAAMTFATVQIILPAQFEIGGVRPYGLVGGGGKWYHFGSPTEPNSVEAILPSEGFTAAIDLGAGISFPLWRFVFDAQARDAINRYWGKTQHDLVFSGGLVWRVR